MHLFLPLSLHKPDQKLKMKPFTCVLFAALSLLLSPPSAVSAPVVEWHRKSEGFKGYKELVVFGDSYSDSGNVYLLSNKTWPISAYYHGVFSNGPVWDQNIEGVKLHNFAFGSATSDSNYIQGLTKNGVLPVPGFIQQIDQLFKPKVHQIDLSKTLVTIWFEGNDIFFNQSADPKIVASNVARGIEELIKLGVEHLVVFHIFDIAVLPFSTEQNSTEWNSLVTNFTTGYNRHIDEEVAKILVKHKHDKKHLNLSVFTTDTFWSKLLAHASTFGITNKVDPCLVVSSTTPVVVESQCPKPSAYFWWDQFHPNRRIHRIIAHIFESVVEPLY